MKMLKSLLVIGLMTGIAFAQDLNRTELAGRPEWSHCHNMDYGVKPANHALTTIHPLLPSRRRIAGKMF
jgi:hypothetical protein